MKTKLLIPLLFFSLFIIASKAEAALTVGSSSVSGDGAVTLQPASGSNLNITLATTGDLAINTNQLYVDTSAEKIGIGTATPTGILDVTKNYSSSTPAAHRLISSSGTYSGAVSAGFGDIYGLKTNPTMTGDVSNFGTATVYGVYTHPIYSGGTLSGSSAVYLYGGYYDLDFTGSTTVSGDFVAMYGLYLDVGSTLGTAADTVKYGLYTVTYGTADTHYSIYTAAGGATNNYALYSDGGKNYFSGDVGIGLTTNQTGSKFEIKDGHIASSQTTAPTGTTGTCTSDSVAGTDTRGVITGTCNNQTLIVAFNIAYASAPVCVVSPTNAAAAAGARESYSTSTSALTITVPGNIAAGTWSYVCMQ